MKMLYEDFQISLLLGWFVGFKFHVLKSKMSDWSDDEPLVPVPVSTERFITYRKYIQYVQEVVTHFIK